MCNHRRILQGIAGVAGVAGVAFYDHKSYVCVLSFRRRIKDECMSSVQRQNDLTAYQNE